MPKHNESQYKTKANAKGVIYAYTRVDGRQVALGRAGEAAWDKDAQCKPLRLSQAVFAWNQSSTAKNMTPGFLQGVGTTRSRSGRSVISKETLVREGHVAWIYLKPELEQVLGQNEGTAFAVPNEWIPLLGDEDQGWVVLRTKEFETCFHGPSVSSLNF